MGRKVPCSCIICTREAWEAKQFLGLKRVPRAKGGSELRGGGGAEAQKSVLAVKSVIICGGDETEDERLTARITRGGI